MTKNFGLSEKILLEIKNTILNKFQNKSKVSTYVFGSRSKTTEKQYSDLDLWIESEPELNLTEITELSDAFKDSDLPIKIDVVSGVNCFAEYRERILSERVLWF